MEEMKRPGGGLASRPLHFFWVVDCSGSMSGLKIGTVNNAIRETLPDMRDSANDNPNAQLLIRALKFSDTASWVSPDAVDVENFAWNDLSADGGMTNIGEAFELLAGQLSIPPMSTRALPPVIVILSDGQATDDYKKSLNKLLSLPWGKKSVRIAIAIGSDADQDMLRKFTGNDELVIFVDNATKLVKAIKWASTVAASVSAPSSQAKVSNTETNTSPVISGFLPPPPTIGDEENDSDIDADVVW